MTMDPIAFGQLLRRRRCAALLTRDELASLSKVSESTIKNTERGRPPSLKTISALLAVPELRLALADLPEPVRSQFAKHEIHTAGIAFLRYSLDIVSLSVREEILQAVMRWAFNQQDGDNTLTRQRLIGWVKSKLTAIEHQRKRLLRDEQEDNHEATIDR